MKPDDDEDFRILYENLRSKSDGILKAFYDLSHEEKTRAREIVEYSERQLEDFFAEEDRALTPQTKQ